MGYFAKKKNKGKSIVTKSNQKQRIKINSQVDEVLENVVEIVTANNPKKGLKVNKTKNVDLKKGVVKTEQKNVSEPTLTTIKGTKTKNNDKSNQELYDETIDRLLNQFLKKRSLLSLDNLKRMIKNKTIILVANSSDLLKKENGDIIDSNDIVVRFNSFKLNEVYTGSKTTIHVSVYLQDENLDKYVPIRFIISNNLTNWINKVKGLNKVHQGLILKYNHHNDHNSMKTDEQPSTSGYTMLKLLLHLGGFKKIDLIGFNFYDGGENSLLRTDKGLEYEISKVHNYKKEKLEIMSMAFEYDKKNNIITFYDSNTY